MKKEASIFNEEDMFWCSVPVPPIDNHKDGVFNFLPEQIANYGQSQTHPSIVYIPGGWNGHEYWLATTPYPNSTGVFENTCIYYGDADLDGTPPRGYFILLMGQLTEYIQGFRTQLPPSLTMQ